MIFCHIIETKFSGENNSKLFGEDNSAREKLPPEILYSLPGMWIFTLAGDEVFIPLFLALIRHLVL